MINREMVRETFASYVRNYNVNDPKIDLKITHTYKVSELCDEIAASLNLSESDVDIAWIIGMLHDIGRFEQCRIYDTFNDTESVDHAKFGCELLFDSERLIEKYTSDLDTYDLIHDAIFYHNVYKLPDGLDDRTRLFANIIRDADKIDIIRANNETPLTDIYNTTEEELLNSSITDEVLQSFYEHHAVLRKLKKTPVDNIVGHISLMFELEFKRSRELARDLGYLDEMMNFKSNNQDTNLKMDDIRKEMEQYFSKNV